MAGTLKVLRILQEGFLKLRHSDVLVVPFTPSEGARTGGPTELSFRIADCAPEPAEEPERSEEEKAKVIKVGVWMATRPLQSSVEIDAETIFRIKVVPPIEKAAEAAVYLQTTTYREKAAEAKGNKINKTAGTYIVDAMKDIWKTLTLDFEDDTPEVNSTGPNPELCSSLSMKSQRRLEGMKWRAIHVGSYISLSASARPQDPCQRLLVRAIAPREGTWVADDERHFVLVPNTCVWWIEPETLVVFDKIQVAPFVDTLPSAYHVDLFKDCVEPFFLKNTLREFYVGEKFECSAVQFKILATEPTSGALKSLPASMLQISPIMSTSFPLLLISDPMTDNPQHRSPFDQHTFGHRNYTRRPPDRHPLDRGAQAPSVSQADGLNSSGDNRHHHTRQCARQVEDSSHGSEKTPRSGLDIRRPGPGSGPPVAERGVSQLVTGRVGPSTTVYISPPVLPHWVDILSDHDRVTLLSLPRYLQSFALVQMISNSAAIDIERVLSTLDAVGAPVIEGSPAEEICKVYQQPLDEWMQKQRAHTEGARTEKLQRAVQEVSSPESRKGQGVEETLFHCIICLSATDPDPSEANRPVVVELPCGHAFHFNCIRHWLLRTLACPLCKAEVEVP